MRRRTIIATISLLLATATVIVAWALAGLPPVRYLFRYGLSPACDPTGRTLIFEGVEFVEIGPGISRMGSTVDAEGGDWIWTLCAPFGLPFGTPPAPSTEMPVQWVEFTRPFWIARTEVTVAQFRRFDPTYRGYKGETRDTHDDRPVIDVSWEEAKRYCRWLGQKAGRSVRLPSESEWECACRGGSRSEFCFGDDAADLDRYGWFESNTEYSARPVATRRANDWGLHDFHGNVWEWCEDNWVDTYAGAPVDGSARTLPGEEDRVCRGGAWYVSPESCRSAFRTLWDQDGWFNGIGFRPAFSDPAGRR